MNAISNSWLRLKGSPEEFERAQQQRTAAAFNLQLEKVVLNFGDRPFGGMTERWRSFVDKIEPGDELWQFNSPEEMSAEKMGGAGYAIVRNGAIRE